jgi:type III pantothenate kinase
MKLFTLDRGNTNVTLGVHQNDELLSVEPYKNSQLDSNIPIIVSIVGVNNLNLSQPITLKKFRTETHFLDMPINYSMTLGEDRIATAYYVYKKEKYKTMIIDAGTFLTVDFVNQSGFMGGYIFPGVKRILETYKESAQLPNLLNNSLEGLPKHLPQNTESAILSATKMMIESSLEKIIQEQKPEKIIMTGGDRQLVSQMINSSTPVDLIPHLVHLGLSQIHQNLVSLKLI